MIKRIAPLALLLTCLLLAGSADAAEVNACGVLRDFTAPTATNNVGRATVGEKTWNLSGTPGPNTVSPQATIGSRVCLSGELAQSQTLPDLLARWTLASDTSASASPAATAAPTSTLRGAAESTLPATSVGTTGEQNPSLLLLMLLLAGAAAVLLAAIANRRRRRGA